MRIIAGLQRGRRLSAPKGRAVRPTSDRVRQALFNLLEHGSWGGYHRLAGARVLDAFCGTGALAFEALSRGAAAATLIDSDRRSLACARGNAAALDLADRCTFRLGDATKPPAPVAPADLAFLDPPYAKTVAARDLAGAALVGLRRAGWFAPGALILVETVPGWQPPEGMTAIDARAYGDTLITVLTA